MEATRGAEGHMMTEIYVYTKGDISVELTRLMEVILANVLAPVIIICGVLGNGLNISVFARMGLNESVTISFFMLSISDFAFTFCNLNTIIMLKLSSSGAPFYVDLLSLVLLMVPFNRLFFDLSNMVTCFIAVARCCCVAMPLTFRVTFTKTKSFAIIGVIYIGFISEYMPLFLTQNLGETYNSRSNITQLVIRFAPNRDELVKIITDSINRNAILIITFVVSLVCLIIITNSLQQSSRFRRSLKSTQMIDAKNDTKQGRKTRDKSTLTASDLQVVKGVSLVLLKSVTCNLPLICIAYSRLALPELSVGKALNNMYFLVGNISSFVIALNTSINCVVYYNFNTRYRQTVKSFFKRVLNVQTRNESIANKCSDQK